MVTLIFSIAFYSVISVLFVHFRHHHRFA